MPAYRARTIKRDRRTRERRDQLDAQILEVLRADHPQSVRHTFYRMTDPRLPEPVEKSERGYRHVQDRLVKLRRAGRVPYGWIVDATRTGHFVRTYADAADFLLSVTSLYRSDLWALADSIAEVWVESRSIAGVIRRTCHELAVPLYPAGGFSSITLAYEAAQELNAKADGRPVHVLYIGDYDPAGVLIDRALERELREHLAPSIELRFERLGITAEQIEHYDLPRKPRKASDRRAQHVEETVEAEAMPAKELRRILRRRIEALLPEGALAAARVAEESERQALSMAALTIIDPERRS